MSIAAMGMMMGMQAIPQIMSLFGGNNKAYKRSERAMEKASEFASAAADPTSKMYKAAQEEAASPLRRQAIQGAEEMFKVARRARARGYGSSMVNPERRDEMRSKALMHAFEQASQMGGQAARQRLQGAANAFYQYSNTALGLGDRYAAQAQQRQQTVQNLFNMGGQLGGAAMDKFAPNADQSIGSWMRRDLPNFFQKDIPNFVNDLFAGPKTVSK